jgi:hypothetical protein
MFGVLDIISYTYENSVRKAKAFRKTDGMHGDIEFAGNLVGYESGLEKVFATMMAIDPQVVRIIHQPMTYFYEVTTIPKRLRYTPDYRVVRDNLRPWIWGNSINTMPADCLYEVKPQEVLDKRPLQMHGAQWSLIRKIQEDGEFGFHIFTNHSIPLFQVKNMMRVGNSCPKVSELGVGLECVDRLRSGSSISLPDLAADITRYGLAPLPVILGLMNKRHIAGQYFQKDFLDREATVIG